MADKKISQLTAASTPLAGTEVLPVVQSSATVQVSVADLTAGRTVSAAQYNLSTDVIIARDAANTLALRNSTSPQAFNIYNTYTSGSVYERAEAFWLSNSFTIRTAQSGGSARSMTIGTQGDANLIISTNTAIRADFSSLGIKFYQNILLPTDNTYDIGAASANRPRNLFLGSYAQLSEMTAPAAPAANSVRIYAVDNGGGKTQLMALFATGAAQQIAIEP